MNRPKCKYCGQTIMHNRGSVTCGSEICVRKRRSEYEKTRQRRSHRPKPVLKCIICGVEFERRAVHHVTCGSPKCQRELLRNHVNANNKRKSKTKKNLTGDNKKQCLKCDTWFVSVNDNRLCDKCHVSNSEIYDYVPTGGSVCHTLIALP